jgi:hypothetical protein
MMNSRIAVERARRMWRVGGRLLALGSVGQPAKPRFDSVDELVHSEPSARTPERHVQIPVTVLGQCAL